MVGRKSGTMENRDKMVKILCNEVLHLTLKREGAQICHYCPNGANHRLEFMILLSIVL